MNESLKECNVDHFLISTREDQLLLIFVDQVKMEENARYHNSAEEGGNYPPNGAL